MNKTYGLIALAVVVLGAGFYLFTKSPAPAASSTQQPSATNEYHDNIYLAQGGRMTDFAGMTLYTFDKDSAGVSACTDACAEIWKPYSSGATGQKTFPTGISVITRANGSQQFAWQGKPLYYFNEDVNAGDAKGDGKNGVWHVVPM